MSSCHQCGSNSNGQWLCGGSKCYAPRSAVQGTVYEDAWRRSHGSGCLEVLVYLVLAAVVVVALGWFILTAFQHPPLPHRPEGATLTTAQAV